MATVKIEPSGCVVYKGKIQIRFSFYLDPTDTRYSEHHVYVIDETSQAWLKGYKGKVDEFGNPIDQIDYDKWIDSLPHIWEDNPFHNHFEYVDASITDTQITTLGSIRLAEFFNIWKAGKDIIAEYQKMPIQAGTMRQAFVEGSLLSANIALCESRLASIKDKVSKGVI